MNVYKTKQGDMLDEICHKHYGSTYGQQVETVLEVNRSLRLAEQGPYLPAGIHIVLPIIEATKAKETVSLFS